MVDPITLLGTAGAVANIIDVLAKSISTIGELRSKWQDADLSVLALESQLAALNTALIEIKNWAESGLARPHYQLLMDLDRCVACCRLLINKIDGELSKFEVTEENRLQAMSKFRLLLKTSDFENIQRMIEKQAGAMVLLLTACNTTMLSEQKKLLETPTTRQAFDKMESDSASLFVHRDVDSLVTSHTATSISSSRRSIQFIFDTQLFSSRPYERWIRGSVKKALHQAQKVTPYSPKVKKGVSNGINRSRSLKRDLMLRRNTLEILMLGSESRADITKMMTREYYEFKGVSVLHHDTLEVCKSACESAKAFVVLLRQFSGASDTDRLWDHASFMETYVFDPLSNSRRLDPAFKDAIEFVLQSPFSNPGWQTDLNITDSTKYFLAHIGRISSPDYTPNEEDMMRTSDKTTGVYETQFYMDLQNYQIIDVVNIGRQERKKWLHLFEKLYAIIYVVDLDTYDEVSLEHQQNRLTESLLLFDSIVNSQWFQKSVVILLLNNVSKFKNKLAITPVVTYFPDYTGANDARTAANYILEKFHLVNRAGCQIYPIMVEDWNTPIFNLFHSCIQDSIIQRNLRSFQE